MKRTVEIIIIIVALIAMLVVFAVWWYFGYDYAVLPSTRTSIEPVSTTIANVSSNESVSGNSTS